MAEHNPTADACFDIAGELSALWVRTRRLLRDHRTHEVDAVQASILEAEASLFTIGRGIERAAIAPADPAAQSPAQCSESTPVESEHCESGMITWKLCGIDWPESQGVGCPSCVHGPAEVATTQPEPEPPAVEAAWPDPSREPEPEASAVPESFGLAAPAPEPPKPRKTPQKTFAARYHAGQDRPINLGEIRAATVEEAKASLPQAFAGQEVEIDGMFWPIDFAKIELVRIAGSTTPRPTSKALVNRPSYDVDQVYPPGTARFAFRVRGVSKVSEAEAIGERYGPIRGHWFGYFALPSNDGAVKAAGGMVPLPDSPDVTACFVRSLPLAGPASPKEAAHA